MHHKKVFIFTIFIILLALSALSFLLGLYEIFAIYTFAAGLIILLVGGEILVDGASKFAECVGVSSLLIGLTIVAFGTSLPEFFVSFLAIISGSPGISAGNIIGSNIANIGLVLGFSALLAPIYIKRISRIKRQYLFMMLASFLTLFFSLKMFYEISPFQYFFGRIDGLIFLTLFIIFIVYAIREAKREHGIIEALTKPKKEGHKLIKYLILIVLGLIGVLGGAGIIVHSGTYIARAFGISEWIIGLSMVAVGTSLPELATSVTAALKKEKGLAIGNIVGSNIFNLFLVLGFVGVVMPISMAPVIIYDIIIMIIFPAVLSILIFTSRNLTRRGGLFLLLMYIAYIVYLIIIPH